LRQNDSAKSLFCITSDWAEAKDDEEELSVWEDNWDDDNVEDDFNQQLRAELEKQ
jgi:26 proteasome complex subunit DSS1